MAVTAIIETEDEVFVEDQLPWIDFYGVRLPAPERAADVTTRWGSSDDSRTKLEHAYRGISGITQQVADQLSERVNKDARREVFSNLSLFGDSGLPRVSTFANGTRQFSQSLKSATSLGFVPVRESGFRSLVPLDSVPVSALSSFQRFMFGLLPRSVFDPFGLSRTDANRPAYMDVVRMLSGMSWQESDGFDLKSRSWLNDFGEDLTGYLLALFSGDFVDRGGRNVRFDFDAGQIDFTRLDQLQVSPQVAGQIVAILAEFLGDKLLSVPYYSASILKSYRDSRAADPSPRPVPDQKAPFRPIEQINYLRGVVKRGALTPDDTHRLGIAFFNDAGDGDIDLSWDVISETSTETTPVIDQTSARIIQNLLSELDAGHLDVLKRRLTLSATLDQIRGALKDPPENSPSILQTRFTCFKTGVIRGHLHCIFVNRIIPLDSDGLVDRQYFERAEYAKSEEECEKNPDGKCECTRAHIGSNSGRVDYSDLVGKIISFAGQTAARNARTVAGGLIRGLSIASLDNEVIAEAVASSFATLWKKAAEWATFEILVRWITDEQYGSEAQKEPVLNALAEIHNVVTGES